MSKTQEELVAQNAKLQEEIIKQRVAINTGLPLELADRIRGVDEEDMLYDAKRLSRFIQPIKQPEVALPPLKSTEPMMNNGENSSYRKILKEIKGD